MLVYPQNAYVKILTPNLIVLGGGVWGRQLDHKYGILKSGIVRDRRWISLKLSLSSLFTFSVLYHMRICWEDDICKPGRGHPSYTMSVSILILNFPSSRTVRDKCLLFKLPSLWYSIIATCVCMCMHECMYMHPCMWHVCMCTCLCVCMYVWHAWISPD